MSPKSDSRERVKGKPENGGRDKGHCQFRRERGKRISGGVGHVPTEKSTRGIGVVGKRGNDQSHGSKIKSRILTRGWGRYQVRLGRSK